MANRQISEERKFVYYAGTALIVVGFLLFASFFLSIISGMGKFGPDNEEGMKAAALRMFVGFGLIIAGIFLTRVGLLGAAGAGVILDPEQARKDVEPLSRMAGGVIGDAMEEARLNLGQAPPERVVMVKCGACGVLNDEDAKFCKACGRAF